MAKLTKTFETKPDYYGFRNSIDVEVDFNQENNSIDNLSVMFYSQRIHNAANITDLFETVPEFVNLVDNIDWNEIYAEYMAAKAEKEREYA